VPDLYAFIKAVRSYTGSARFMIVAHSLGVTLAYVVLLVVAGLRAHSLALLSEAGHNLSDFVALLLSLVAVYLESRPPSATKTYGWHRAGVLAALVNAGSLVVVSFLIFYEAFRRLQNPRPVHAGLMIWVAAAGLLDVLDRRVSGFGAGVGDAGEGQHLE